MISAGPAMSAPEKDRGFAGCVFAPPRLKPDVRCDEGGNTRRRGVCVPNVSSSLDESTSGFLPQSDADALKLTVLEGPTRFDFHPVDAGVLAGGTSGVLVEAEKLNDILPNWRLVPPSGGSRRN